MAQPTDNIQAPPLAAISVIIPVRDRKNLLLRAVASVLSQDWRNLEVIVVDDGSTDGGPEAVAALRDPRVRLLSLGEQNGANAARNRGILESRAPLVAFLDSDDVFHPHKLSTVLAIFKEQPDLGTLVDSYHIVNPLRYGGRPEALINRVLTTSESFLPVLYNSTIKARRLRKATSGITVRREVAIRAGLFNENVLRRQDMEFLVRLAKTARCATTDAVLWTKYEQPESMSFKGDGFIASTLMMGRAHPEYRRQRSYQAADVAMYLWESLKRRRLGQIGRDLRLLTSELGVGGAASLIGSGLRAWQVDARLGRLRRQRPADPRST